MGNKKKLLISATALLLLGAILSVVWLICDWPPPLLILKYGLPPAGGPTGRRQSLRGIEFIELSPGYFRMGSHGRCSEGDLLGRLSESVGLSLGRQTIHDGAQCPIMWVEVPYTFWLAEHEITVRQFGIARATVGGSDSGGLPVSSVTWEEASSFCRNLELETGAKVRLPTENEWEFACRAGSTGEFCFGDGDSRLKDYAWYGENSRLSPHPVRSRMPNAWGFYDLHGNLHEWCGNGWIPKLTDLHRKRPASPEVPTKRAVRGGTFVGPSGNCECSRRFFGEVGRKFEVVGFRPMILDGPVSKR